MSETTALSIDQMCFSLDGSLAAAKNYESWDAYKSSVCVFDTKLRELTNEIYLVGSVRALAFDHKNNLIAAYLDTKINVVDIFTGEVLVKMDATVKCFSKIK